jgi:hypothetical protein
MHQDVIDRANLEIVHPLPKYKNHRAGDNSRDQQDDPVERRQTRNLVE